MRRRIAAVLGLTLAASALALVVPSPASADTNVCAGQGTATTGPLVYPVTASTAPSVTVNQPRTVGFGFGIAIGACAPDLGKTLGATGTLTGWCGHSSGQGTTSNGHSFAWISVGTFLILTGHVVGIVSAFPDPLIPGNSCLTGATSFLVTGAVALIHCPTTLIGTLVTVPIPGTLTTVGPLGVHTGPMNYHVNVCA